MSVVVVEAVRLETARSSAVVGGQSASAVLRADDLIGDPQANRFGSNASRAAWLAELFLAEQ